MKRFLPRHLNEIQSFLIGVLCTLLLFILYLEFLSSDSPMQNWKALQRQETELQDLLKKTEQLVQSIKEYSDSNQHP